MQWKLRNWQRAWERRKASLANRSKALSYQHQTCPSCGHPASADEKLCTRCGEALGGRLAHQLRKAAALVWAPDTPVVATLLCASIGVIYVVMMLWSGQQGLGVGVAMHPVALFRFGSLLSIAVAHGAWWRLSTSTFLHASILHLAFNAASLW